MIWIICSFTEAMIIFYALQQFLFCGSGGYTTEIVVQYVRGIAIAAGMLFVTALMAFIIDTQKDLPVDMGVSFPYLGPYYMKV